MDRVLMYTADGEGMAGATELKAMIRKALAEATIVDIHTHLFPPGQGGLLLRGADELLTYHYLTVEALRHGRMSPRSFFAMSRREQADEVWRTLFVENSPMSEACRGVLSIFKAYGLNPDAADLSEARAFTSRLTEHEHVDMVFKRTNISFVVMTNDPFDGSERPLWGPGFAADLRFRTALRADFLITSPEKALRKVAEAGFAPGEPGRIDYAEIVRFLGSCADKLAPLYAALSLPPDFGWEDGSPGAAMMEGAIIPFCRQRGIPLALMIGVKRGVNPQMMLGGDAVGAAEVDAVGAMCRDNPDVKFMVTLLSRENQHELCVAARKFPNLLPFGCWWFLNNPSLVREITGLRLELLGMSFIPQHSDARVLDQLIYKWEHFKQVLAGLLFDKYFALSMTGRTVSPETVRRDVRTLLSGNALKLFGMEDARR